MVHPLYLIEKDSDSMSCSMTGSCRGKRCECFSVVFFSHFLSPLPFTLPTAPSLTPYTPYTNPPMTCPPSFPFLLPPPLSLHLMRSSIGLESQVISSWCTSFYSQFLYWSVSYADSQDHIFNLKVSFSVLGFFSHHPLLIFTQLSEIFLL